MGDSADLPTREELFLRAIDIVVEIEDKLDLLPSLWCRIGNRQMQSWATTPPKCETPPHTSFFDYYGTSID